MANSTSRLPRNDRDDAHPSGADLSSVKVAVLGGGLVGLWTAWRLAQSGAQVAVYERGRVAGQASWAGGGILCPLWPWQAPSAVWQLALDGARLWRDAAEREGAVSTLGLLRSGMHVRDNTAGAMDWARRAGVRCQVRDDGGVLLPDMDQLRTPWAGRWMAARAARAGATIHAECGPVQLQPAANRRVAVQVASRSVHADHVVLATGAWTDTLLAGAGLAPVGITPVRGQMLALVAPDAIQTMILAAGRYLIPRADGLVLVGSTVEHVGFDVSTTPAAHRDLREHANRMAPALRHAEVRHHWAGLRPGTATGEPVIGRVSGTDNLWVNAGHHRNGVAMAPAAAQRLVAELCAVAAATTT